MDTGTFADYSFGSGTEAITFIYTVRDGDSTEALDAWDAPAYEELSVSAFSSRNNYFSDNRTTVYRRVWRTQQFITVGASWVLCVVGGTIRLTVKGQ